LNITDPRVRNYLSKRNYDGEIVKAKINSRGFKRETEKAEDLPLTSLSLSGIVDFI